jgi:SsrA-binding protein
MINRRAKFEYTLLDQYTAGIVLTGPEIKSLRSGRANLNDSYCVVVDGEIILKNMFISRYDYDTDKNSQERRDRKLLLTKKEIKKITSKLIDKGLTIIPLSVSVNKYAKIKISVAKGKKLWDKRETIKNRDIDRNLKSYI